MDYKNDLPNLSNYKQASVLTTTYLNPNNNAYCNFYPQSVLFTNTYYRPNFALGLKLELGKNNLMLDLGLHNQAQFLINNIWLSSTMKYE